MSNQSAVDPSFLPATDMFGRPLKSLRLSVTDRCNLRCQYCMPEEEYVWLPREDVLTFEEMATLTDYFTDVGVDRVRLTGGEPLLRRDLPRLVRLLMQNRKIMDIALTTNGILLADQAQDLYDAGLHRITVSLDTLRPERFRQLTRRDEYARVLEGIESVGRVGFTGLKLDTVAIRGFNDTNSFNSLNSPSIIGQKYGLSSIWMSVEPMTGRSIRSCRALRCCRFSASITATSNPCRNVVPLRLNGFNSPTEPYSASFRQQRLRSVRHATEAA